jgi:hypothetical protein
MNEKRNLMQCEMCGALTLPNQLKICRDCIPEDQRLFEKARESMSFGESLTIDEISKRTGIEEKTIRRWVKTGRLSEAGK